MSGEDITVRQAALIRLMLAGKTQAAAAVELGISERTARRYLASPEAAALLTEAVGDQLGAVMRLALDQADEALAVLARIFSDEDAKALVRVSAARSLLEYMVRLHEVVQLAARVEELERQVREDAGDGDGPVA